MLSLLRLCPLMLFLLITLSESFAPSKPWKHDRSMSAALFSAVPRDSLRSAEAAEKSVDVANQSVDVAKQSVGVAKTSLFVNAAVPIVVALISSWFLQDTMTKMEQEHKLEKVDDRIYELKANPLISSSQKALLANLQAKQAKMECDNSSNGKRNAAIYKACLETVREEDYSGTLPLLIVLLIAACKNCVCMCERTVCV